MMVDITSGIVLFLQLVMIVAFIVVKRRKGIFHMMKSSVIFLLPVLFFLLTLYFVGFLDSNPDWVYLDFFGVISASISGLALKVETLFISHLFFKNALFTIAFIITYLLIVISLIGVSLVFFGASLFNMIKVRKALRHNTDILLSLDEKSFSYATRHPNMVVILIPHKGDKELIKRLYELKIPYLQGKLDLKTFRNPALRKHVNYNLIHFGKNTNLIPLIKAFKTIQDPKYHFKLHLETRLDEMELYRFEYLKERTNNPHLDIKFFTSHELGARLFVEKYPLPAMIDEAYFLPNRSLKEKLNINVFFLGFGDMNATLLPLFCQNNQLISTRPSKILSPHLVNYYLVDTNNETLHTRRLSHFINSVPKMKRDLPAPEDIGTIRSVPFDLRSSDCIKIMSDAVYRDSSFTLFIVAHGDDHQNLETALWLKNEFGDANIKIACRNKRTPIIPEGIIAFGNEAETYTHDVIVAESMNDLAASYHQRYSSLKGEHMVDKWSDLSYIDLFSNLYSAMNLRYKLNLLGYDMERDTKEGQTYETIKEEIGFKSIDQLTAEDYFKTKTQNVLAYAEKLRWNAFYIFHHFHQLRLKDIKMQDGRLIWKDLAHKKHACLTSLKGLKKLHNYVLKQDWGLTFKDIDCYRYDYMFFGTKDDNFITRLNQAGYQVVRLIKESHE
ncbi:MAG: hypothetical protein LBR37_01670 [Erysipelotrichaceae bacterium]|jgi:hypothetical protein|nr:hypothetical protein [Erysipelotrichaceae bacterium]